MYLPPCVWGIQSPLHPELCQLFKSADIRYEYATHLVAAMPQPNAFEFSSTLHNQMAELIIKARKRVETRTFTDLPMQPLATKNTLTFKLIAATPYNQLIGNIYYQHLGGVPNKYIAPRERFVMQIDADQLRTLQRIQ